MSIPTFNKFKSTTVYGVFNNLDYEDNSIQASANIQRNLTVGGDVTSATGNIKGKKLYYDNVDIDSTYVKNTSLTTTLNSYASLAGATFFGALNGVTPLTNDISSKVATTSFVNNVLSATLTGYANLSGGATFTGALRAVTQTSTDNTALVATTAFVKNQNYLTSASLSNYALTSSLSNYALTSSLSNYALSSSLSNYALTSSLSNYALLSGATFSGALRATTQGNTDSSTLVATTAYVKNQSYLTSDSLSNYALTSSLSNYALTTTLSNYALSSSLNNYALSSTLSNYALSSALSNYALLSGATFTGTVNCNNGLTTLAGKDVQISCNNTFPTTNSGGKQGLGFFWNQSGGRGEVNLLTYGQGGAGGLSIWNSNVTNAPSKIVEFYPDGSTFNTAVNGITPTTSNNSTQFATTAWVKLQNYLTSSATPTTSTTILPELTTVTFQTSSGTYSSYRRVNITLKRAYINGMTQLNYSSATNYLDFNQNTFNGGASQFIIVGVVSAPVPSQTYEQFVFGYDFNGVQMPFFATIIPNSSGVHYLVLKMCNGGSLNQFGGTYSFPNFNLMYI